MHERSEIAHERADETSVEQFVRHGFLRCGLDWFQDQPGRYRRAELPYQYGIRYGSFGRSEWLPALDSERWRCSTPIQLRL